MEHRAFFCDADFFLEEADDDFFEDRDVGCSLSRLLRQSRRTRSEREHGDHRGRDKTVG